MWFLLLFAIVGQCTLNIVWDAEVEVVSCEKDSEETDDQIELLRRDITKPIVQHIAFFGSCKGIEDEELPLPPHLGTGTPPPRIEAFV